MVLTVTKGDDIRFKAILKEDDLLADLSQSENIAAAITSRDGSTSYVQNLQLSSVDPEADWASSKIVVTFPKEESINLPTGGARLEVQVTRSGIKDTWYDDAVQVKAAVQPGESTLTITVTKNDDIRIEATLREFGSPADLSGASNISASIKKLDGTEVYVEDLDVDDLDPESDWAAGKVVIIFSQSETGTLPRGIVRLEIVVIRPGLQASWIFDGVDSRFGVLP